MGLLLMSSKSLTGSVVSHTAHYDVQARSICVPGAFRPLLSLHAQKNLGCTQSHSGFNSSAPLTLTRLCFSHTILSHLVGLKVQRS